jgi:hypothetical protein
VFVTLNHLDPILMPAVKAGSLPLEWSPVRSSAWVGWIKTCLKILTESDKHSSLLRRKIHYERKKIMPQARARRAKPAGFSAVGEQARLVPGMDRIRITKMGHGHELK